MRAICLCSPQGVEEALADIGRAQALDPGNAEITNDVGRVLQSVGRDEAALPWFDQALKLRPNFSDAHHNKAVTLARMHRFEEALATYERLKAADPTDALADLGRGHSSTTGRQLPKPAGPDARRAGSFRPAIRNSLGRCGLAMRPSKARPF